MWTWLHIPLRDKQGILSNDPTIGKVEQGGIGRTQRYYAKHLAEALSFSPVPFQDSDASPFPVLPRAHWGFPRDSP